MLSAGNIEDLLLDSHQCGESCTVFQKLHHAVGSGSGLSPKIAENFKYIFLSAGDKLNLRPVHARQVVCHRAFYFFILF